MLRKFNGLCKRGRHMYIMSFFKVIDNGGIPKHVYLPTLVFFHEQLYVIIEESKVCLNVNM